MDVGVRLAAVDIDSPAQHAAMVDKLSLPFPILSDPDRSQAIDPLGVADPKDDRNLARPALILVDPAGDEQWRFVSRDYADRLPEEDVLVHARTLGLEATSQSKPEIVGPEPGPRAMPAHDLRSYFRGAKFAAQAMGLRHRHLDDSIKHDSIAYVDEMDRYMEALSSIGL